MKGRDEPTEDPIAWGRLLIETQDHDPLYTGLAAWDVKPARLRRFLLAYWSCYSVGASWYISAETGSRFWDRLQTAAENEVPSPLGQRWPRAHERRHWRGEKCVKSVLWLRSTFRHPEDAVESLETSRTLADVERRITGWPMFGPWIAFKAADMMERLGVPIAFSDDIITLYKDPRQGAELAGAALGLPTVQDVIEVMKRDYRDLVSPGRTVRPVNIQEIETCLCKWKSALHGSYWIGCDTTSHRQELAEWGAHDLLAGYPTLPA